MVHELGELFRIADQDEEVVVVGQEDVCADLDLVETGRAGEGAAHNAVERALRAEEETALEGTAGDFDEGALGWDETESSAHGA
jgi:hypothetical protein